MKEELIEYFHGNTLEIEKEKQRKRELMSHFPKMLGTVDETRYVLQDDDKANIWSHYGERNVDPPTLAVISNESEKSKEQKDEDVTVTGRRHPRTLAGRQRNHTDGCSRPLRMLQVVGKDSRPQEARL